MAGGPAGERYRGRTPAFAQLDRLRGPNRRAGSARRVSRLAWAAQLRALLPWPTRAQSSTASAAIDCLRSVWRPQSGV